MAKHNNPKRPEFPQDKPRFPATDVFAIPDLHGGVLYVKDESINPWSGTHKDRMAHEIVVSYKNLQAAFHPKGGKGSLPQFSIISSGSAALAVARALESNNLPRLKVLVDSGIRKDPRLLQALNEAHCEVFQTDLSLKPLDSTDILRQTNNKNGFDLTAFQATTREVVTYDWLAFEILNEFPDFVFLPFGTGTLFRELLYACRNTLSVDIATDPRYYGRKNKKRVKQLRRCSFLAATTDNPDSAADKLYAPFRPFAAIQDDLIDYYKSCGFCGPRTGLYFLEEHYINKAFLYAQQQGVTCEPSGAAGLALLFQLHDRGGLTLDKKNKKVLIVNTGKLRLDVLPKPPDTDNAASEG